MSDVVKMILAGDGEAAEPIRKSPLVAKIIDGEAKQKPQTGSVVAKLVSAAPPDMRDKQKGPVTVIMQTPYGATETKGLLKALSHVNASIGKVGKVLFEGSFVIGRKLPRLAGKFEFTVCVRDHPGHLKAFSHLGGSGRTEDPMEEVRERLDDDDRLLRRGEQDAFEDLVDMAAGTVAVILMPGSSRMALAEQLAAAHGIAPVLAAQQSGLTYMDEIEMAPAPANLLIVTPDDFTDIGALLAARTHLSHLGRSIGKIIHSPSPAMEVLTGLGDGVRYQELDMDELLSMPLSLFDTWSPNYIVVAGSTNLGAAVMNIASHRTPKVPCAKI